MGSGRSGTSVLARAIDFLGVDLGTDFIQTNNTNPKGFFENKKIVQTHKSIHVGKRPFFEGWNHSEKVQSYKQELKEYIQENFLDKEIWGWKDPRNNEFLEMWQDILKDLNIEPHYLIIIRNPVDVISSYKRAYNRDETWAKLQWQLRTLLALRNTNGGKRVIVEYEELFDDSLNCMHKISQNLQLPWPKDEMKLKRNLDEFIDPNLQTSNSKTNVENFKKRVDVAQDVKDLYLLCLEGSRSHNYLQSREFHNRVEKLYQSYLNDHGKLKRMPPKK
ncbi:hypothetical protein GCM10009001_22630 [Virgibacillus siamensis]|uniref:Sulfotransferase family protein n=1 Tax=Virgibacillus siamensis TaxID=480071 RepID=A0ABN1G676_9BACI